MIASREEAWTKLDRAIFLRDQAVESAKKHIRTADHRAEDALHAHFAAEVADNMRQATESRDAAALCELEAEMYADLISRYKETRWRNECH